MAGIDTRSLGRVLNELLILSTLRAGSRHGYQLALEAEARSRGAFVLQYGTLYPILHRMEKRGELKATWDAKPGRRRRVYALTHAGASRLRHETGELRNTFQQVLEMLGSQDPLRSSAPR